MTISCSCHHDVAYSVASRVVTARKTHQCGDCGAQISPGKIMMWTIWGCLEYSAGGSVASCGFCMALLERFGDCVGPGQLTEKLEEIFDYEPADDIRSFFGSRLAEEITARFKSYVISFEHAENGRKT